MGFSETPGMKPAWQVKKKPKKNPQIPSYSAASVELDLKTQVNNSHKQYQFWSNSIKGIQ